MNKKNSIKGLFILQLPPPIHGAAMVNDIIKNSKLINQSIEAVYINSTTAKDISDIGKNGIKKYFSAFKLYIEIIKNYKNDQFDFTYITLAPHGFALYKDAIFVFLAKLFNQTVIIHLHGKGIKNNYKKSSLKRRFYKTIFKNTKVIHLSKLLYFDIDELVSQCHVYYIPNGINGGINREVSSIENILYLSNMQETKGSFTLLQAAKILKEKNLDFHLNFVGKWHNDKVFKRKWLHYFEKHNLKENVSYVGPKYGNEKEEQFKNANLFVFPTYNDCFPITLLEAMSFSLPVISTDEGAISEILDENSGLIVPKQDPEKLADAIENLIKNPEKASIISANARKRYELLYTQEVFEKKFLSTIKKILSTKI